MSVNNKLCVTIHYAPAVGLFLNGILESVFILKYILHVVM